MGFGGGKGGSSNQGLSGNMLPDLQSARLGQAIRSTPEQDYMRDQMMGHQNAMMDQMAMAQQQHALQGMPRTATEVMQRQYDAQAEIDQRMRDARLRFEGSVAVSDNHARDVKKAVKHLTGLGKARADRPIREILQEETDGWLKDAV